MSDANPQREPSTPLGARDNWWGNHQDQDNDDRDPGHPEHDGVSKLEFLAHDLLKTGGDARLLSATTLFEDPDHPGALHDENHDAEMSEPECRIPLTRERDFRELDYGAVPHRLRYDTEYGYVGGVVIADRPTEEFLDVVDSVVEHCQESVELALSDTDARELHNRAARLKQAGRHSDVEIMELVLEQVQDRL